MKKHEVKLLACDIGAESGRGIMGHLSDSRLRLEEVHRFNNGPIQVGNHLFTDILNIWNEIQTSLQKASDVSCQQLASVGVDTWGVDYVLLDKNQQLLGNPYHYRDRRTKNYLQQVLKLIPAKELYNQTGNQILEFNTIFQLLSDKSNDLFSQSRASVFLMLPDLLHLWLSGVSSNELSNATTTQCFNQGAGDWAWNLLQKMEIPFHLFQNISYPSTILGKLQPWLAASTGLQNTQVVLPATHDTGSALTAIPVVQDDFMYISSGTWSLVGVELEKPNISHTSYKNNVTNEWFPFQRTSYLKLVPGMWILQQCHKEWTQSGKDVSYENSTKMAEESAGFPALIDVNDPDFFDPGNMPSRIRQFCLRTMQRIPETHGEIVRCVLESMACQYFNLLQTYEEILQKKINVIHIIGGGSRNWLLNQLTANYTDLPVISGPVEATAIGNLMIQAMGLGYVSNLSEIRQVVKNSVTCMTFEPDHSDQWIENYSRYSDLFHKSVV
jgi:rhamnulokinase